MPRSRAGGRGLYPAAEDAPRTLKKDEVAPLHAIRGRNFNSGDEQGTFCVAPQGQAPSCGNYWGSIETLPSGEQVVHREGIVTVGNGVEIPVMWEAPIAQKSMTGGSGPGSAKGSAVAQKSATGSSFTLVELMIALAVVQAVADVAVSLDL